MTASDLRAWWAAKQGLDGSLAGTAPGEVLERSGWSRSVGGVGPYFTVFGRSGGSRKSVDEAAASLKIYELPSARGCTYVVPERDFALALRCGGDAAQAPVRVAAKLGVTPAEIDKLCAAVVSALGKGPLDPDGLREATGSASRSLGAEGVKKGMFTTLPLALGLLQAKGAIRRVPVDGRLDRQRYRYALWNLPPVKISDEEVFIELARRYFRWIGPASMPEFQWFSGLGVKAAKAAMAPLELVDAQDGLMLLPDEVTAFRSFRVPAKPDVRLMASTDALFLLRRNHVSLVEEADRARLVAGEKGPVPVGGIADLPNHAIVDRGRLIGAWEYDQSSETIAWMTFEKAGKGVLAAVESTEQYIKEQLGDARSFSLDSPKSRESRIRALREA